jgi:hypothetical protein
MIMGVNESGYHEIDSRGYSLVMPFVIDGDGYTDRDRQMFVAGYEFCQLHEFLEANPGVGLHKPVHRENEDRIRVLCRRLGRKCSLMPVDDTWSSMTVSANGR